VHLGTMRVIACQNEILNFKIEFFQKKNGVMQEYRLLSKVVV